MNAPRYGHWPSTISVDDAIGGSPRLSELRLMGSTPVYLESRPADASRSVLVARLADGETVELTSQLANVRTRVNLYGGGAWCPTVDPSGKPAAVFINSTDGFVCRTGLARTSGRPRPADRLNRRVADAFWADPTTTPDGRYVVAVRERNIGVFAGHDGVVVELVALDTTTGQLSILAGGSDFYSSPRISPDGSHIAWITWSKPDMPWDNTTLWRARLVVVGEMLDIEDPEIVVAGDTHRGTNIGGGIATVDPMWDHENNLWFVSDAAPIRSDEGHSDRWWNLCVNSPSDVRWSGEYEVGRPHWVYGMMRYGITRSGSVIAGITRGGVDELVAFDPGRKGPRRLLKGVTTVESVAVGNDTAWAIVAGPTTNETLVEIALDADGKPLACTSKLGSRNMGGLPKARRSTISVGRHVSFPVQPMEGSDIGTAHGFYMPPTNPEAIAVEGCPPPLIVMIHGGPTSAVEVRFNARNQFWTSRGFAILDVNYRGSVGYGRKYRDSLLGWWGVADVADCVAGAEYLAAEGLVDADRMAIRGSSAGGFTVLRSLANSDVFRAGVSLFGVSDLALMVADTHRFEATYLDALVAPWPAGASVYEERSPMRQLDQISAPMLVFQGAADTVVPMDQSRLLVAGLKDRGIPVEYHEFRNEGHGFKEPATLRTVMETELAFYLRELGL